MVAVAPVLELVDVERYALTLAGQLVACAVAGPVLPAALCLAALRAAHGAHTGLPSAERPTCVPVSPLMTWPVRV